MVAVMMKAVRKATTKQGSQLGMTQQQHGGGGSSTASADGSVELAKQFPLVLAGARQSNGRASHPTPASAPQR